MGVPELMARKHVIRHGTTNEYMNFGCRCAECREVWRIYCRTRRPCPDCGGEKAYQAVRCQSCDATYRTHNVRPSTLRCCSCREWKPDDAFSTAPRFSVRRGRSQYCKACDAAQKRRWRHENREKYNAYERERKRRKRVAA